MVKSSTSEEREDKGLLKMRIVAPLSFIFYFM